MRRATAIGLVLLASTLGCKRAAPRAPKSSKPAPAPAAAAVAPVPAPASDAVAQARAEFELIPQDFAVGTSKLYARGDFLPLDDPRGISEGDFIGRLRTLFGPVPGDDYVLRHKATGLVVTAYSAQSGPSYGGGPRYPGELPHGAEPAQQLKALQAEAAERTARIQADPELAQGRPVDWQKIDARSMTPEELKPLRQKDHDWMRHFEDVAAPPGFAAVAARLEALVESARPADWQATRYWEDDPTVYVVGAQDGQDINRDLQPRQGLEWLLQQAERAHREPDGGAEDTLELDLRVLEYWSYHEKDRRQMHAGERRAQAAWFRAVAAAEREDPALRDLVLQQAQQCAASLELDPQEAQAALRHAKR